MLDRSHRGFNITAKTHRREFVSSVTEDAVKAMRSRSTTVPEGRTRPIAGAARAWHFIRMGEAIGTFEQVVSLEPQHETLLRALRALAFELHPDLVEVARPGDRAVSWGWGPKKMSEAYACALPYKDHVNLAFYRGADLVDPAAKLRGTGKAMRHMPLTKLEQLDDPAVRELLAAARVERQEALRRPV